MTISIERKLCIVAIVTAAIGACTDSDREDGHEDLGVHGDHAVGEADRRAETGEHDGDGEHHDHDPGGSEESDLDRSVEELFAATCEHGIKTHACAECRYEVGVVEAPASLFEGGLIATVKAERRPVSVPLRLTGEVQFDERRIAHVSSLTEGIIRHVHVALGDKVEPGQPLVEIESVAVGEAQATVFEEQAMLTLAERNYERVSALSAEGIASEKELIESKQELAAARIRTSAARAKLERLGMSRRSERGKATPRGRLVLRAPTAGTVLQMHAVAGEVAKPEEPLVTIGDNASLWVWADVYERDIALVMNEQGKRPLAAMVSVKAFPGEEFAGTVDFISPSMNESSRTVKLRISVPNTDGRLLAGMFASVDVFIPGEAEVLALPADAVLSDSGRAFVFVRHSGDYFVRRPVIAGRRFAGLVEVASGLSGDELVVSNGAFLMKSDVLRSKMGAGCAD